MFTAAAGLGGLEVQLCWYQGFGEFYATPWVADPRKLLRLMTTVTCLAGETQLRKVVKHAVKEYRKRRVNALVFIGDAFEEDVDRVGGMAGEMGLLGLPASCSTRATIPSPPSPSNRWPNFPAAPSAASTTPAPRC